MKQNNILLGVYMGIIASLCWIIGDLLIVGFTPMPENYPLLSQTYASKIDVDIAVLMLSGSTNRLMWGALVAVFSIPLYLYSTFSVVQTIKSKLKIPVFILLFVGFAYAPLGHAGFFYVGEIYKAILNTDVSAHNQLLETASGFVKILKINWIISLTMSCLGWLLYGVSVALGKTTLKKTMFWVNPIIFIFSIILIVELLLASPMKDWVACAIFNEANFIFFVIFLIILKKNKRIAIDK